ncbi:MAG: RIP metalloprotease RseP [Lachnospiraceae bacterium]|nr:RIP metalloprotease RseP [Lachnospiraceae bacterium]
MNILIAILIFGLIVVIHELGHFIFAKINGIYVSEFSVGFGPRLLSKQIGETRYSLKLIPFGGSCAMLGEEEESTDERAFNNKSAGARFWVIFGGPLFNFILAFVMAIIMIVSVGIDKPYVLAVQEDSLAAENGLQEGDIVIAINGDKIHLGRDYYISDYFEDFGETVELTVLREGKEMNITIDTLYQYYGLGFSYSPDGEAVELLSVEESGPLGEAGLTIGDVITKLDGIEIKNGEDLAKYKEEIGFSDKEITVTYVRNNREHEVVVTPKEINSYSLSQYVVVNTYREKVGFLEAMKYSLYEMEYQVSVVYKSLGYLFTGKASMNDFSGPVRMVSVIGDTVEESKEYGMESVIFSIMNIIILLSVNLGVMNLLPFPALDGGHLVFIILEAIRKKKIPQEKEAMVHFAGIMILFAFMIFILFNDIKNVFF